MREYKMRKPKFICVDEMFAEWECPFCGKYVKETDQDDHCKCGARSVVMIKKKVEKKKVSTYKVTTRGRMTLITRRKNV